MTYLTWRGDRVACILAAIVITGVIARTHAMPCPSWLRWLLDIPATRRRTFTPVLERLALRPGLRVLDIGCGYGRLTIPIARLVLPGGEVVGVDIQEAMLRIARERSEKSGLANLSFRRAAAGEGALGPGQFDRALLVTVLGEIPRQARGTARGAQRSCTRWVSLHNRVLARPALSIGQESAATGRRGGPSRSGVLRQRLRLHAQPGERSQPLRPTAE